MSNISSLFCTPEQGKRLAELVPELTSVFAWTENKDEPQPWSYKTVIRAYVGLTEIAPALTLQELRDVAEDHFKANEFLFDVEHYEELDQLLQFGTAPKLAAWVIELLEEVQP